jgi:hypothetical protein
MDDVFVLDARERFRENVGELLICRDVLHVEASAFIMISYEMISNIDVLRPLIVGVERGTDGRKDGRRVCVNN